MYLKQIMSACLLFCVTAVSNAAQWELQKTDEDLGIKIYTSAVDGSPFRQFKAVTTLNSSLTGAVAMVRDTDNMPNWMFNMLSLKVLEKVDVQESIAHSVSKTGPFMDNRDSVVRSVLTQDPKTKAVTIKITGLPEYIPAIEDSVRVASVDGSWTFTPKADGKVEVIYQLHADPAGDLPQGLVNSFMVKAPMNNLSKMHELVGGYQNAKLSFIAE